MGEIATRYKSHLVLCMGAGRGQFMCIALLCLGELLRVERQVKADGDPV